MTYEEALEEAAFRIEELGGIGAHTTPEAAKRALETAAATLRKLEAAVAIIHKMIEEGGDERYLAE